MSCNEKLNSVGEFSSNSRVICNKIVRYFYRSSEFEQCFTSIVLMSFKLSKNS